MEESGTYIDMLNKVAKRNLIQSTEQMASIKDIRNMIAHEYANKNFDKIVHEVLNYTPLIFSLVEKLNNYSISLFQKTI